MKEEFILLEKVGRVRISAIDIIGLVEGDRFKIVMKGGFELTLKHENTSILEDERLRIIEVVEEV